MSEVDKLLHQSRLLWRGSEIKKCRQDVHSLSTGYQLLDDILPEKGWPVGALVDFILPQYQKQVLHGIGELRLVLPAMCQLHVQDKWLLWVDPPYIPYAPALQSAGLNLDRLSLIQNKISHQNKVWVVEKALRTAGCGMVLCWVDALTIAESRRLQLAAEQSGATGFLFQKKTVATSVASLRLKLNPLQGGVLVEIIKARGASRYLSVELQLYRGTI